MTLEELIAKWFIDRELPIGSVLKAIDLAKANNPEIPWKDFVDGQPKSIRSVAWNVVNYILYGG